jgi:SAM-dependent methyltransferase
LEIGCGSGRLSLWFASKGHHVVCSNLKEPSEEVKELHGLHGVSDRIDYQAIDATDIPYSGRFDIIFFKSVLGRIGAHLGAEGMQRAVREVHKALKPTGKLLFAENLRATSFHMFCRRRFGGRTESVWKYPTNQEILGLLAEFSTVDYELAGFLGTFGRTEAQRTVLGCFDKILVPLVPRSWRYIMAGVAAKAVSQLASSERNGGGGRG